MFHLYVPIGQNRMHSEMNERPNLLDQNTNGRRNGNLKCKSALLFSVHCLIRHSGVLTAVCHQSRKKDKKRNSSS